MIAAGRHLGSLAALLRAWPNLRGWATSAIILVGAAVPVFALGQRAGYLSWSPRPFDGQILAFVCTAFFIPALGEELLFRGLLIPARRSIGMAMLSVLLFVLWHPLQTVTAGPSHSALFLQPWFLVATMILGVAFTAIRWVTSSLWPAIIGHWLVVVVWKTLLGGPF
jgi:uncharacterized protein